MSQSHDKQPEAQVIPLPDPPAVRDNWQPPETFSFAEVCYRCGCPLYWLCQNGEQILLNNKSSCL